MLTGHFRRFIDAVELQEIPMLGRKYTWSNESEAPTLVRLDRVFCMAEWDIFPDYLLQSAATMISDHCPLILGLRDNTRGKQRFHFESFWPKLDGFLHVVQAAWSALVAATCPFECLSVKYKRVSRALQSWGQRSMGHIKLQLFWASDTT